MMGLCNKYKKSMYKIVLVRHGQSVYNKEKIFCGWTDVDLTEQGLAEAHAAGKALKREGFHFDIAFTSVLKRAKQTLDIILTEMDEANIPIINSWRLNERHYGALQSIKHADMSKLYGEEQVRQWRRSYSTPPPLLTEDDPRYPGNDPLYKDLKKEEIPKGESLENTVSRVLPFWQNEIVPKIKQGKKVIISASGNSLRALIKYIDNIGDDDIMNLEIATGTPLVYELDGDLKPTGHFYLK